MNDFYFIPQTGLAYDKPPRSNFYAFRLLRVHLAEVEATIARATVGSGGLEYPLVFIRWLHRVDLNRTNRTNDR